MNHKATQLVCCVHPRGGCKEQTSPCCPGRVGPLTSAHPSTSPGLGYAKLQGKSPGAISPGGFWQLQHTVPCSEASLSAFPSSGLSPLGSDAVNEYCFPHPLRDRDIEGPDGYLLMNTRNLLSVSPGHIPTAVTKAQVTWHDKGQQCCMVMVKIPSQTI